MRSERDPFEPSAPLARREDCDLDALARAERMNFTADADCRA